MKKRAIITYFLALALLLSACVGPFIAGGESTPPHSDTSPTFSPTDHPASTDNISNFVIGDTYTEGPYTFQYESFSQSGELFYGWFLISCEDSVEVAVIPSEIMGIPVIGVGHKTFACLPFGENSALKSIAIPDTVMFIGFKAFYHCAQLTDLQLSSNVITLGYYLLSDGSNCLLEGTAVTFLEVPEGTVKLCEYLFAESSLESVVLPSTLDIVEYGVFKNTPLKEVFYRGTAEQCPQTLLDQVLGTDATIYYLSETEPTEDGNYWRYVDGQPVIW